MYKTGISILTAGTNNKQ
ncbi:unnamed protein product, partial [Allacma fusca]